jgi:hypothetical protein
MVAWTVTGVLVSLTIAHPKALFKFNLQEIPNADRNRVTIWHTFFLATDIFSSAIDSRESPRSRLARRSVK